MRRIVFAASAMLAVLSVTSVQAQQPEQTGPTKSLIILSFRSDLTAPKDRQAFVFAVNSWCRDFRGAAPTNTPAEAAWVRAEANTTDSTKISRLTRSAEWARSRIADAFNDCVERSDALLAIQQAPATPENLRAEAVHLISLALAFNDESDLRGYVRAVGVDEDRFAFFMLSRFREQLSVAAMRTIEGM